MNAIVQSFLTEASAKGARSTVLHSLQWVLGILLSALAVLQITNAEQWLKIGIAVAVGLILLLIVIAFIYCLVKCPDALRSEQFSLSKMAIEKGMVGDDLHGLIQYQDSVKQDSRPIDAIKFDQGVK